MFLPCEPRVWRGSRMGGLEKGEDAEDKKPVHD